MAFAERAGTATTLKVVVRLLPLLTAIACSFIANIPVSVTGGALPPPLLALVPIYFWCLVRPDLMSPGKALLIGLVEDILSGSRPPGSRRSARTSDSRSSSFASGSSVSMRYGTICSVPCRIRSPCSRACPCQRRPII